MIGRRFRNRYEIVQHLGDGSTATVYRAKDLRLGRDVALKMLLPHVRETTRKRFFQEANAAAQLNHPNIMAIYDIDEENGQYFLVVEYVEGDSLTHYVPSPADVVVELGRQIATALQYAHDRDIIHRDVKPANIMVTPDRQVKLMDLGLALPREAKRVTADGMIIGTPAYLSPEQAQGQPLDARTDIYSLGVVLYEMATGQLPFDSDDIPALLLQQVKQAPPPPRLVVPDLPVVLEGVILKCLEKKRERRFQSCEALAVSLDASLSGAVSATATSSSATARSTRTASENAARPIRLVLADDHTLLRKTLIGFLEGQDQLMVVGEAGDGDGALAVVLQQQPDILILDLNMPGKGGLDVLPDIRIKAPQVKVLVLTGRNEDWYIMQALRSGAHGYLLKSAEESDLLEGIQKVMQGHLVLGHGVAEKVVTGLLGGRSESDGRLTDKERSLLLYVAAGYENDQIAGVLGITMPQVIELLASTMNKLSARDRSAAALTALKQGYILIEELHTLTG
jgi:DNA-binding NarL/FixJ family response regulator